MSSVCLVLSVASDDDSDVVSSSPRGSSGVGPARRSSFHSTSCGVLTIGEDHQTVYFPELNLSSIATFKFDHVFPQGYNTADAYVACARPLVSSLLSGLDSCLLLLGDSAGKESALDGPSGFLSLCCADVLRHASDSHARDKTYEIRLSLSWCALDANRDEGVMDLIRGASSPVDVPPTLDQSLSVHVGRNGHVSHVPGLWEVELCQVSDVMRLADRVRANVGTTFGASESDASSSLHHVVSLHVDRRAVSTAHISKGRGQPAGRAVDETRNSLQFIVLADKNSGGGGYYYCC